MNINSGPEMPNFVDPSRNQEIGSSLESRIDSLNNESGNDIKTSIDVVMERIFDPHSSIGVFVGGSPDAKNAVLEGLVSRLEKGFQAGLNGDDLKRTLWPISSNLENPEPSVLDAMKNRTNDLEESFSISSFNDILDYNDGYVTFSGAVEHPDFSYVEVMADNHTHNSVIKFSFYEHKPTENEKSADMKFSVYLGYLNKKNAPNAVAVSDGCSYFTGAYFVQERKDNDFEEEISLDIPKEMAPLLSSLTKNMIAKAIDPDLTN